MKKIIIVLVCVLYTTLYAQGTIDKEIMSEPGLPVIIKINSGFVEIKGTNDTSVKVTGKIGKNVESLIVEKNSEGIHIRPVIKEKYLKSGKDIECSLYISVPFSTALKIESTSGAIKIFGVNKTLFIQTITGNATIEGVYENVECQTVSGTINIKGSSDFIECSGINGNYVLTGNFPDSILKTSSGFIKLTTDYLNSLTIFSSSGEIDVNCDETVRSAVNIKSVNSKITFGIHNTENILISIKTISGSLITENVVFAETSKEGNRMKYKNGNGESRVFIESITGNIVLKNNKEGVK
ncbi:MAG: hypothetical protein A2015_09450 [Spirochaetes bacterium GWF1_31_7]|nr:MAG: hypothetical protein A2Y30_01140 [Spirochaetes bacterium GWE1_32_154]OHD45079.1 MAG: hypothetical protein A2Y29_15185 [Spirochaetes bacterium GWE2_31_10]OHD52646.1 MAG: hypothetical protein A2015_09450 [Spirochaetes bacterium GWF1_31_7]OHD72688.1 MAG: hypothetical protein A2355_05785 [Spirochaetes bacterium RIFOXYB1_FULL_32_8]HBD95249.1 hypothetical protein [Spirochaetia bacterium]